VCRGAQFNSRLPRPHLWQGDYSGPGLRGRSKENRSLGSTSSGRGKPQGHPGGSVDTPGVNGASSRAAPLPIKEGKRYTANT
jgi:hypothetical protein